MKLPILAITAMASALSMSNVFADDQPAGCKCEMMKKPAPAPAAEIKPSDASVQQSELDKLVVEMNGNLGPKKVEAMAAIVTRLVEQSRAMAAAHGTKAPAGSDAPKSEGHQH